MSDKRAGAAAESLRRLRGEASLPGLGLLMLVTACIWLNSTVPGEGSGAASLMVVDAARGMLDALGLPSAWVTNFLVRKAGHVAEYALLGLIAVRALGVHRAGCRRASGARGKVPRKTALMQVGALAAVLLCAPCVDECIQRFVPGRSGQLSDVLIDCAGGICGSLLSWGVYRMRRRGER